MCLYPSGYFELVPQDEIFNAEKPNKNQSPYYSFIGNSYSWIYYILGHWYFGHINSYWSQRERTCREGNTFFLEDYKDRPVVLNFWASWCPPCRDETPGMERVWRKYKDDGVIILGINVQDGEKEAQRYISEFGVTFFNALDLDGHITVDYGVTGLPVTFFINEEGFVIGRWVGSISERKLDSWVSDLLFSEDPIAELNGENPNGYRRLD